MLVIEMRVSCERFDGDCANQREKSAALNARATPLEPAYIVHAGRTRVVCIPTFSLTPFRLPHSQAFRAVDGPRVRLATIYLGDRGCNHM